MAFTKSFKLLVATGTTQFFEIVSIIFEQDCRCAIRWIEMFTTEHKKTGMSVQVQTSYPVRMSVQVQNEFSSENSNRSKREQSINRDAKTGITKLYRQDQAKIHVLCETWLDYQAKLEITSLCVLHRFLKQRRW